MKCKSASTVLLISSVTGSHIGDGGGPVEWFSIGEVLAVVQRRFPEVSLSKIRYLESRGLITPARTSGGTRRYALADIELIERILEMQTREFMPLDVIAERLSVDPASLVKAADSPDLELTRPSSPEMDVHGFLMRTGLTNSMLVACQDQGLIVRLDAHGAAIARMVVELNDYGLEPRHLRSVRLSASRIVDLVDVTAMGAAAAMPEKAASGAAHGAQAGRTTADARRLVLERLIHLHTALVIAAMRD